MAQVFRPIRAVPGTDEKNGQPEKVTRPYVYRGTGRDVMPWAILKDDDGTDYSYPILAPRNERWRCPACMHSHKSRAHKDTCR